MNPSKTNPYLLVPFFELISIPFETLDEVGRKLLKSGRFDQSPSYTEQLSPGMGEEISTDGAGVTFWKLETEVSVIGLSFKKHFAFTVADLVSTNAPFATGAVTVGSSPFVV